MARTLKQSENRGVPPPAFSASSFHKLLQNLFFVFSEKTKSKPPRRPYARERQALTLGCSGCSGVKGWHSAHCSSEHGCRDRRCRCPQSPSRGSEMWKKRREPQPHPHITMRRGCMKGTRVSGSKIQLEKQVDVRRGHQSMRPLGGTPTLQRWNPGSR